VDGRNPAPVDRGFIPLFTGFQPSKVVQDFFHPQYHQPSSTIINHQLLTSQTRLYQWEIAH